MDYKIIEFDADSPGFLAREKKRLAVVRLGEQYRNSNKLEDEVAYFEAMIDFLTDRVDAPRDELEGLSANDIMKLFVKVMAKVADIEEPDPKALDNSAGGTEAGNA